MRGLYLTPAHIERLLDPAGSGPTATKAEETSSPLKALINFGLDDFDLEVLLIALAPDLDARFERLYAYLNDDVTRRRPTVGLALELLGADPFLADARRRFQDGSALVAGGLLVVEEAESPFLARPLRVPDRIAAYLLGDRSPDPQVGSVLRELTVDPGAPGCSAAAVSRVSAALQAGVHTVYLCAEAGSSPERIASAALGKSGSGALGLDLRALSASDVTALVPVIVREARLWGAGLVAGPVDVLDPVARIEHGKLLRSLAAAPSAVVFYGQFSWDPLWSQALPLSISVPGLAAEERADIWRDALSQNLDGTALEALAAQALTPEQIKSAADNARALAHSGGEALAFAHVRSAVRAQNAAGLARLARRIDPAVCWDDLVLPEPVIAQLRELTSRALHRGQVLGTWSMRPGGGRGHGVTALFAGDSGTGKTMSAEALAAELGLDLYVVDLSRVVDKYIGETEKNLDRVFAEAAGAGGVLLFDEADAIFGKRSEVHDAHDRYANLETAYLLQRMESFDGIAILTTNLQANLDEAFTRRLDAVVEFPLPDRAARHALWNACLGPTIPRDPAIDLAACARFELTGGAIRSCAVTAAYRVAREGRAVRTADLFDAVRAEYRKLGRLVSVGEFDL